MTNKQKSILVRVQRPLFYVIAACTLLLSFGTFSVMNGALLQSLHGKEELVACNLAYALGESLAIGEYDRLGDLLKAGKKQDDDMQFAVFVTMDGQVIAASDDKLKSSKLNLSEFEQWTLKQTKFTQAETGSPGVSEAIVPLFAAGSKVGVLRIRYSDKRVKAAIESAEYFIFGLPLVTLILIVGLTRKLLQDIVILPIRKAGEQAERIAQGELGEPLVSKNNDELGRLAESMNGMMDYLREMSSVANSIAQGDLSVSVRPRSSADLFGNSFQKMVESLYRIIQQLTGYAQNLSVTATQLAAASSQQTNIISQQASSIQESTTTLEEIRLTVNQASEKAESVVAISNHTLEASRAGGQAISESIEAMNKIKEQVEEIAYNILDLTNKTAQIREITTSVNEIAEQSKLLAVNAAIEAIKAGESGRGFGVVASEVKNLANESKLATAQVHTILEEVQKATASTAVVTEEGTKRVESGVAKMQQIGDSFNKLYQVITESSNAAQQIASVTHQQVTGIEQIAASMANISESANETVVSAHQQSSSAQDLSSLAACINDIVKQYRLEA